jgi:putative peptide zinc metalloprotease protein
VAALATFVWAKTSPGALHNLAYNMMFVASVSTIVFNINPLLRFDGYYILSDLLEIPNLHQRAGQQLRYFAEKWLFGLKLESPTRHGREALWLTVFGIASGIYRVFVFGAILLFVADRFLLLGLLMAAICAVSWVAVPVGKLVHYLANSPRLDRNRHRAIAVTCGLAAVIVALLQLIPFPSHFRAPGVLQAHERTEVINETAGYLDQVLTPPGTQVRSGQPLLQLSSRELELNLADILAQLGETEARLRYAMQHDIPSLKPLHSRLEAITNRLIKLQTDRSNLVIAARHPGVWVAPRIDDYVGRWVNRGTALGLVINPISFEFKAAVLQDDADALFAKARTISGAQIRLRGQAASVFPAKELKIVPAEQRVLPSAALGWMGGGEIPVAQDDPNGRRATEPFFEVQADVGAPAKIALFDGRAGKIRFDLPAEPLLPRWIRRLRQFLQKRYQI